MVEVKFELNGETVITKEDPTKRLLDVIRTSFGLTGPKEGCGEGECGGCAVLIDHKIMNACITPLGNVHGKSVVTIDAFAKTQRGQTIRKAFETHGAVQCGICTPGMVIATESLLHANPNPTEAEIREGLSGNLCRCTGYNMIVKSILSLVEKEGSLW